MGVSRIRTPYWHGLSGMKGFKCTKTGMTREILAKISPPIFWLVESYKYLSTKWYVDQKHDIWVKPKNLFLAIIFSCDTDDHIQLGFQKPWSCGILKFYALNSFKTWWFWYTLKYFCNSTSRFYPRYISKNTIFTPKFTTCSQ